jgi:thiol-disulfide isomerase/thioredoxin
LAPELADTGEWINSGPFTLSEQTDKGKVVLVDFWTYTCINCIRTMPYLRDWYDKYRDKGLVILGVHTPEFEFEKVLDNVTDAVESFGLEYPIVQDNDFGTWNAFNNRAWPAKYLIDVNRTVRYTHFGEGAYDETEAAIRELLVEAGYDLEGIPLGTDPGPEISQGALEASPGMGHTRELYAGTQRNYNALVSSQVPPYVRHTEYYEDQDVEIRYSDPGNHDNHYMYLEGLWFNGEENLVHARATTDFEDYIVIQFYSTSVNGVMTPTSGAAYRVRVTLDGQPVPADRAGIDIRYDEENQSYVEVDEARMYFLISQTMFGGGELKLSSNSPDFALFAFTFGSYEGGEPGSES